MPQTLNGLPSPVIPPEVVDRLIEGVLVVGSDLCCRHANDSALRWARTPLEFVVGRSIAELFPAAQQSPMLDMLKQCLCERAPRQMFQAVCHPDGSEAFFQLRFEPIPDGVVILSLDVTASHLARRSEHAASRARAVLCACRSHLVRASDESSLMANVCGVAVNQGGYLLAWIGVKAPGPECFVRPVARAGMDRGYVDALNLTWLDTERGCGPTGTAIRTGSLSVARHVAEEAAYHPWREQAVARGFRSSIALPLRLDGEIWGALSIYSGEPDAFHDDECELLSEIADDLGFGIASLRARAAQRRTFDEQERLERELRKLNAELEQRVALRTRQLEEARDAAEAANRAKTAFLRNMSHEVRTPMNAILGFSQLMLRDPTIGTAARQHVESIARAGGRLVALIEGVLQLAGIQAGRVTVQETNFDVLSVISEVAQWLRPQADLKGVQFVIDTSRVEHRFVAADEDKLRLVLAHLVGNAIKFTERGVVSLLVSTVRKCGGGLRMIARVEDSGPGIAPEELTGLFQTIGQTLSGRSAKQDGAGVGLAISQEYARLMGGRITAESQRGSGTVFRLEIPVSESSEPHAVPTLPAPAVTRLATAASRPKVLVAIDDELERAQVAGLLCAVGFDALPSRLDAAAGAPAPDWRPDLVLVGASDIDDCRRFIDALRAVTGGPAPRVICLTPGDRPGERAGVSDAGADAWVQRPVVEAALLEAIRPLLGIEYEYNDAPESRPAPDSGIVPMVAHESRANLPGPLRARIHHATVAADLDALMSLLAEVETLDPVLASRLRAHASHFDYVPILELVGD